MSTSTTAEQSSKIAAFLYSLYQVFSSKLVLAFMATVLLSGGAYKINAIYHPPMPAGSFSINTDGSTGTVDDNQYHLKLPLEVANGTENIIYSVTMDVTVYGCLAISDPISMCRKIDRFEERYDLQVGPSSYSSDAHVRSGEINVRIDGQQIAAVKIVAKMESMLDDKDVSDQKLDAENAAFNANKQERQSANY